MKYANATGLGVDSVIVHVSPFGEQAERYKPVSAAE